MGLTLGCSECHDHKFDPVSQVEYYQLFALFNNIEHQGQGFAQGGPHMIYLSPTLDEERIQIREKLDAMLARLPIHSLSTDEKHLVGEWNAATIESNPSTGAVTGEFTITATIRTTNPVGDIISKYDWRDKQLGYVFGIGAEFKPDAPPGHLFAWIAEKKDQYGGVEIYGSQELNDGRDHHVAITFEPGKAVKLYVDGLHDTAATIKGTIPKSVAVNDRRLSIGRGYSQSPEPNAFQFDGEIP